MPRPTPSRPTTFARPSRPDQGPVEAVRGVSLDVGRGEIFGLLGPNGAGKTTTLRMLTTLLPIDAGSATRRRDSTWRANPSGCASASGTSASWAGPTNWPPAGRTWCCRAASTAPPLAEVRPRVDELAGHPRPVRVRRPAGQDLLGRPAPPARRGAGHRAPAHRPLPRRADDGARPPEPGQPVGPPPRPARPGHDDRPHHPLPGGGRRPLRPARHRRPRRDRGRGHTPGAQAPGGRRRRRDHRAGRRRRRRAGGRPSLGQEPYVREITAEGDQLRLYVEDGERGPAAAPAAPRPRADRRPLDEPVRAHPRRRVPPPDRPVAPRHRRRRRPAHRDGAEVAA